METSASGVAGARLLGNHRFTVNKGNRVPRESRIRLLVTCLKSYLASVYRLASRELAIGAYDLPR